MANSSLNTSASRDNGTLHNQMTSELAKYLQEATERRETRDNYFDGCHRSTNTSPLQQEDHQRQENIANGDQKPEADYIPESRVEDTGPH